jgi:hypothetical protein
VLLGAAAVTATPAAALAATPAGVAVGVGGGESGRCADSLERTVSHRFELLLGSVSLSPYVFAARDEGWVSAL